MPVLNFTLPENTQSVSRPIIYSVIEQLQTLAKIDKSAKIYFAGDIQKTKQPHSSLNDEDRSPQLPSDRMLFLEVEENFSRDMLGTNAINQYEHMPIFHDSNLAVSIRPIYATTDVKISFKYRTHSKSEAERWHNEMWMKVTQLRDTMLHDFDYHYLLPPAFIELLKVIHEHRETIDGYNDSFEEYLFNNATGQLTLIGDLANQDARLSIIEKQCRVIGLFDFDSLPEKTERNDADASWTINFDYKFSYEKPVGAVVKYPIMIHSQLLPKKYVLFSDSAYNLDKIIKRYSNSIGALSDFEIQDMAYKYFKKHQYIKLPSYDEFILNKTNIVVGTHTVFLALCGLDPVERSSLINLMELGTIAIDPLIMRFIVESEYPYITKMYDSIIQVQLYRNNYLTHPDNITCDRFTNIKAKDKLDLRNEYRVRFSFVTDLTLLSKDALRRLGLYPDVAAMFIQELKNLGRFDRFNKDYYNRYLRQDIPRVNYYTEDNGVVTATDAGLYNSDHPLHPVSQWTDAEKDDLSKYRIQFNTIMITSIISLRFKTEDR
jgi:hypothetical protein